MNYLKNLENKKNVSCLVYQLLFVIAAIIVFFLEAKAWPLSPGRDFSSYVTYYFQSSMNELAYPRVMLHRTPVFPMFLGWFSSLGGQSLLEFLAGLSFVFSVLLCYKIGSKYSTLSGIISCWIVLIYPAYGAIYHFIGSEFLTSMVFLLWVFFVVTSEEKFELKTYIISGILAGILIWIRPGNQIFVLFCFYPFLLKSVPFRLKVRASSTFLIFISIFYFSLSCYNYIRYDYFGLASGFRGTPFLKVFVKDKLIKPENGPVSKALGELVERELLDKQPYLAENITKETFFENPTARKWFDILILSEGGRLPGNNPLRQIAIEAIMANPLKYLLYNVRDILVLLSKEQFYPQVPKFIGVLRNIETPESLRNKNEKRILNNKDDDIAISYFELVLYQDDASLKRIADLQNIINSSKLILPQRGGDELFGRIMNFLISITPGMLWFIVFGLIWVFYFGISKYYSIIFMLCMALCSVAASSISVNNGVPHYRIIFDPLFIIVFSLIFSSAKPKNGTS